MIRVGIVGYGNIARGVELALKQVADMELKAIFSRRKAAILNPLTAGVKVYSLDEAEAMAGEIDVLILCGGSAKDLPEQAPRFAANFNIVDSYDTHAKIPEYIESVNNAAVKTAAIISTGWDPGLFSVMREIFEAILPNGESYTFWGRGLSQGHSDAIRGLDGIKKGADGKKMAVQYTIPAEAAITAVRSGKNPALTTKDKHVRECFVVAENGADTTKIAAEIKTMPHYFADYTTTVNFITEQEFMANHTKMPHGGFVFRSGKTGQNSQFLEFALKLDSNPEFTASVMVAYARAAVRLAKEGSFGAKTVLDVPPAYLSAKSREELLGLV